MKKIALKNAARGTAFDYAGQSWILLEYGETPCTAEQLALKAMQKQAALGAKHLKDAKADNDESGAAGVGAAPNGGEEGSENDDKAKVDAIVGLYNSTKSQNGGKK